MIRRSPTRIELKLEDMQEFEYVLKADRRKGILSCPGAEEARKLIRQERIGYAGTVASPRQPTSSTATSGSRRTHHSIVTPPVQPNPRSSTSIAAQAAAAIALAMSDDPLPQVRTQAEEDESVEDSVEMMEVNPPTHGSVDDVSLNPPIDTDLPEDYLA